MTFREQLRYQAAMDKISKGNPPAPPIVEIVQRARTKAQGARRVKDKKVIASRKNADARHVLELIATLLEAQRNRFGKLEFYSARSSKAREELRLLAVELDCAKAHDVLEQAANVARKVLE